MPQPSSASVISVNGNGNRTVTVHVLHGIAESTSSLHAENQILISRVQFCACANSNLYCFVAGTRKTGVYGTLSVCVCVCVCVCVRACVRACVYVCARVRVYCYYYCLS